MFRRMEAPEGTGSDLRAQLINERAAAQRAREIAEDRASLLKQIGDNLPDGALYQVIGDASGARQFIYWSAGIERLIGVSADEAIADATNLYRLVHPEDVPALLAAELRSFETLCLFDVTARVQHRRTGEWRWVHLRSAPRQIPDGRTVWDGIYLDITEQKRTEEQLTLSHERLDLAQQAGHIGVFDWDIQTGTVVWTEEEQRIFGLAPGTFEGTIDGWSQRLLPEDAERMSREIDAVLQRREPQMNFSFRIVHPSAGVRWIEGAARFSYAAEGKPLRMVGVNIDVTDRRETENALQAADRRKNEFLAMLSHELRNPLAAISNALQLCDVPSADTTTFQWSRIIMRRQLTHLTHLVDDLLDVTRITSGKIDLRMQNIDLADVLDSVLTGLKPLFAERRHRVETRYAHGELQVRGDSTRLEQVIVNLLTNAAKYTPPAGLIELTARKENGDVVVVVRDTGVGIPADEINEMFELFAQGHRSIARSEGGLGLGLTIARTLIEMHGGNISAASLGEGQGAEFTIRLPAATPSAAPEPRQHPERHATPTRRTARVLVVDDHADTAVSLARLLRAAGHSVEIAHDGHTALEAAATFHPEIILLDLGLPGLDGYTVAERLRAKDDGSLTTIIAISGYGQEEDRQRSRDAGIDHHLVKPVSFEELSALLSATGRRA